MAVKCYFSGIEGAIHFNHCVTAKVKHVLCSYWQFGAKDPGLLKRRKKSQPWMNFMVDSGAHTFITSKQKFMSWTRKQFDDYVENYVKWIYDNRRYITVAVEFDIDHTLNVVLAGSQHSALGTSIVESWQKSLFMPLQKKGIDIIYVWHEARGMEGWEEMCSKFDYVGLPGVFSSEPDFNKYMAIARRYTTRVHGFAATKQLDFRDVPWYSIDSITWKTGEMYGTLIDWNERIQKLTFVSEKSDRPNYRHKLQSLGFDADGIVNDTNYKEVTRYGLFSMRQMEAFYENRYADRTFYYELRLPHRAVINAASPDKLRDWWRLFRPDVVFKQHTTASLADILEYLCAISAAQNGDTAYLSTNKRAQEFLKCYFPKLVDPLPSDIKILQKEVSVYLAPPNPPPLQRLEEEHWLASNNPPKSRNEDFTLDDIEMDDPAEHILARFL